MTPDRCEVLQAAGVHLRFATTFLREAETVDDPKRAHDALEAVEGHLREALTVLSVPE